MLTGDLGSFAAWKQFCQLSLVCDWSPDEPGGELTSSFTSFLTCFRLALRSMLTVCLEPSRAFSMASADMRTFFRRGLLNFPLRSTILMLRSRTCRRIQNHSPHYDIFKYTVAVSVAARNMWTHLVQHHVQFELYAVPLLLADVDLLMEFLAEFLKRTQYFTVCWVLTGFDLVHFDQDCFLNAQNLAKDELMCVLEFSYLTKTGNHMKTTSAHTAVHPGPTRDSLSWFCLTVSSSLEYGSSTGGHLSFRYFSLSVVFTLDSASSRLLATTSIQLCGRHHHATSRIYHKVKAASLLFFMKHKIVPSEYAYASQTVFSCRLNKNISQTRTCYKHKHLFVL